MDWSRAKTVLIVSFLLLNGLLGYQLWVDELNLDAFADKAAKREETMRLLEAQDIKLETDIPEGTPALNEITVQFDEEHTIREWSPVPEPFPERVLQNETQRREALETFVTEYGAYEFDPYPAYGSSKKYVFNQLHDGLPMFQVRLELAMEGGQVVSYRQTLAEVLPFTDTASANPSSTGMEVLSAFTVLNSLAESYLSEGSVISHIQLGYHGPIFESETQVLAPYWRISLASGETYYVHALNGAVESPIEPQGTSGG